MLVATFVAAAAASAQIQTRPYLGIQGGTYLWPAYSNRDQVEADTAPGFAWAVVGGVALEADRAESPRAPRISRSLRRLGARLELEVGQRFSPIHGINDGVEQRTGDGNVLRATSAHVNLWPSIRLTGAWRLYVGGGGGGTWIQGLGSDKRVWSVQTGLGVLFEIPVETLPLRLDLGWRSFFANSTNLRGALADFDAHGGVLGCQLAF